MKELFEVGETYRDGCGRWWAVRGRIGDVLLVKRLWRPWHLRLAKVHEEYGYAVVADGDCLTVLYAEGEP